MGDTSGMFEFSIAIFGLIILAIAVYLLLEKRRKKEVRKKFKIFSENFKSKKMKMRTVPRITVPESLDVMLTFTCESFRGLKAHVLDLSLSGVCVKPDFSLKKFPMHTSISDTEVNTPVNTFIIKGMKTVRIERQMEKRLIAFQIDKIDEDQFDRLKKFIAYLDEFLKNKDEE